MSEAKPCDYQPRHDTLKEILEELGKLYNADNTKSKVFQQLKSYLEPYCGEGYLKAFYKDYGSGYGVSSYGGGTIQLLTKAAEGICKAIINNPSWASRYVDPHPKHTGQTCHVKIAKALQACLPKTFSALLFLFFNVSTECSQFGGGSWNSYKVNDSGQNLYNWLTYGSGSDDFIARGFLQKDLHGSNTGQNVAQELKSAVSLKPDTNNGSLQKVLCGFMFVCSWDDALTGHACLFLSTFCSKVSQGSEDLFQDPYKEHSGAFKDVCKGLKNSLKPFINGSSGLSAVCHGNTNLFESLWDPKYFDSYVSWLKENLPRIIGALQKMSGESKTWNPITFPMGLTAGPFLYGFVFKDGSWKASTSGSKLQEYISKLVNSDSGSLGKLKSFLESPSTPSSAGAAAAGAAGGLFGLGGAGAGAAYATNAFGFQNLVTGLISRFLN
ncbi:hypothetical protein X943_003088 [Babesia divergens]|uniref:Uncharacterized protein n=1 Tax=Babesia divergens TaxID=32595 RepID=A0AAD9GBB8_BABDI|nr:hypothetical protein X943_003088 [Babesia divergens]